MRDALAVTTTLDFVSVDEGDANGDALAVTTTLDFVSGDCESRTSVDEGDADGDFDDEAEMGDNSLGAGASTGASVGQLLSMLQSRSQSPPV